MRPVVVALSLALTSCALYPTVPTQTTEQLAQLGKAKPYTYLDVDDTRDMVRGLRILLDDAAADRRRADTVLREISFYGTLVLVGGTLEKSIAARNIGAGSAGLSSVFSNHYGIKVQRSAFIRAARQVRCLEDAIRPIAPAVRSLFDASFDQNADLANKYYAIPTVTIDAVNRIRVNLEAELEGVALGAPSVTEVASIFEGLSKAGDSAKKQALIATVTPQDVARAMAMFPMAASSAPQGECAMPDTERSVSAARLCETLELLSSPKWEQEDRKKHFIVAVGTFAETVAACSVTKQ